MIRPSGTTDQAGPRAAPRPARQPSTETAMSLGYDPDQRAAAGAIQNAHPDWLIMYGAHSRMFYSFPLFPAPPGAIIAAPSPPGLLAAMRAAEIATRHTPVPVRRRPPGPSPRPSPPRDQQSAP